MITLEKGMTNSILVSLVDTSITPIYKLQIIDQLSGYKKELFPSLVNDPYFWKKFYIAEGLVDSLTASTPTVNLSVGLYHYIFIDSTNDTELKRGLLKVVGTESNIPSITRNKNVVINKR